MSTIVIGSRAWCDYWAKWHWNRACNSADRATKNKDNPFFEECYTIYAMYHIFQSYMWEDTKPWT